MPHDELTAIRTILGKLTLLSPSGLKYVQEKIGELLQEKQATPTAVMDDTVEDF